MDTTETYIKMCDCQEVRDIIDAIIEADHQEKIETHKRFQDTQYSVRIPDMRTPDVMVFDNDNKPRRQINLLSQDQIQEMIGTYHDKKFCWVCTLEGLYRFAQLFLNQEHEEELKCWKEKKEHKMPSLEQLWLAFYMAEKHKKTWDGKEWVA